MHVHFAFFATCIFLMVNIDGTGGNNVQDAITLISRDDFHTILKLFKKEISKIHQLSEDNIKRVLNNSKDNLNTVLKNSQNLTEAVREAIKSSTSNSENLFNHSNINYQNILLLAEENKMELKKQFSENIKLKTELEEVKEELMKFRVESSNWKMEIEKMNNWKMEIEKKTKAIENKIEESKEIMSKPDNCDDFFKLGKLNRGIEKIYLSANSSIDNFTYTFCEYTLLGEYKGGWTVIQRRDDNVKVRPNFKRTWEEYSSGFGVPKGEYWLGLNVIHALTNSQPMQLQIILEDWHNKIEIVNYKHFRIDDESKNYKIHISGFKGNISDRMSRRNEMDFSTTDRDNDKHSSVNCANYYGGGGGWWYKNCYYDNLNGLPHPKEKKDYGGIVWIGFNPSVSYHPLRRTTMMIKPLH